MSKIENVIIGEYANEVITVSVRYTSGAWRKYEPNKVPKTVQNWLAAHDKMWDNTEER